MSFLQIASWNIEHLSGKNREDARQSAYALADHIEMAGVDVIALQEIYVTETDETLRPFANDFVLEPRSQTWRRNRDLDLVCYLLEEHLGDPWTYLILPNRDDDDKTQLCAVLWNASRVRENGIHKLDVDHRDGRDWLWDRTPHAIKFTTSVKVWHRTCDGTSEQREEDKSVALIPLHMKANGSDKIKSRRVREKEARTLCPQLAWVRDNLDPSIILIGDTNILQYDEPAAVVFAENGLIDLNNTDSPTYWSRRYGEAPFDRAIVATDRQEFRYTRQYVLKSADLDQHDQLLSDHYMIKVSVKSYVDDADPREA